MKATVHTNLKNCYIVFFDVDETLINAKSMFSFLKFLYIRESKIAPFFGALKFYSIFYSLLLLAKLGVAREVTNANYYKLFKNKKIDVMHQFGRKWYEEQIRINKDFYITKTLNELKKHKSQGALIVLVSGSFSVCLDPIANAIGADYVLATNLEESCGKYTGKIFAPQIIGAGKAEAIKLFLAKIGMNESILNKSFAYGDHHSDAPMLDLVGNPVGVASDDNFAAFVKNKGWRLIYANN